MKPDSLKCAHLHGLALRRIVPQVAGMHRCLSIQSVVIPIITVSITLLLLLNSLPFTTIFADICYHATLRKPPKTVIPSTWAEASANVPYMVLKRTKCIVQLDGYQKWTCWNWSRIISNKYYVLLGFNEMLTASARARVTSPVQVKKRTWMCRSTSHQW
jgi:hypothetical protein